MTQKGFSVPLLAIIFVIAALIGGYTVVQHQKAKNENAYVPPVQNPPANAPQTPAPTSTSTSATTAILADWKTYRNEQYGFKVRYPADWNNTESGQAGAEYMMTLENKNEKELSPKNGEVSAIQILVTSLQADEDWRDIVHSELPHYSTTTFHGNLAFGTLTETSCPNGKGPLCNGNSSSFFRTESIVFPDEKKTHHYRYEIGFNLRRSSIDEVQYENLLAVLQKTYQQVLDSFQFINITPR